MGRVPYFTVGGCQVLKPCRVIVSFCFMHLVLCTKSENKINKNNKISLPTFLPVCFKRYTCKNCDLVNDKKCDVTLLSTNFSQEASRKTELF